MDDSNYFTSNIIRRTTMIYYKYSNINKIIFISYIHDKLTRVSHYGYSNDDFSDITLL